MKNVYEVKASNGDSLSPKKYIYATVSNSLSPAQMHNITVHLKGSGYYIAVAGTETMYYQLKSDGTVDTSKAYKVAEGKEFGGADDVLMEGEAASTQKFKKIDGKTNLFEALTDDNKSQEPKKFVYSSSTEPQKVVPTAAYLKNDVYYIQLTNHNYIAVKSDGTLDCNNVISAGEDKIFGNSDDKVLFPKTLTTSYKLVEGYKYLYEVLVDGKSKSPQEYIYSKNSSPAQDTAKMPAYAKGDKFYSELPTYATVYVSVNKDGTLDEKDAIWAGGDKIFGTADDKTAEKREDDYYYQTASGGWQLIEKKGTTPEPTDATTTVNPALTTTTGGKDYFPNTGARAKTGLIVSLALLFAGMVYFGYRFFRREKEYC